MKTKSIWGNPPKRLYKLINLGKKQWGNDFTACIVGCSDGKFLMPFARDGINVTGYDIDDVALYGGNKMFPNYLHYEYADSLGEMNFNIFLRSVLAFGGHTAWAAIEGASFGREKKINLRFIKYFAICFILHALWDTDTQAYYLKLTVLCIAAWWVIIRQLETFIRENADPAMQMKAQEAAEKQREARKLAVKKARDKCVALTVKVLETIIKIILFAGIGILILLIIDNIAG